MMRNFTTSKSKKIATMTLLPAAIFAIFALSYAPSAFAAVTFYHVSVTVTFNGQTTTKTFQVTNPTSSGVLTMKVGGPVLHRIQSAFGTTTFVFPGTYTRTFLAGGKTGTMTVSSTNSFTVKFVLA